MNRTLRDAFDRWKDALIDQDKQTTQAARHRAHARVTSMEDLIAETPADDIEGVGIKLALYVYMSGVDPEKADSAQPLRASASAGVAREPSIPATVRSGNFVSSRPKSSPWA